MAPGRWLSSTAASTAAPAVALMWSKPAAGSRGVPRALGFLVFGEVPDVWTVTGAAFIVASGLYTAHRERVRRSQLLAVSAEPSPNA